VTSFCCQTAANKGLSPQRVKHSAVSGVETASVELEHLSEIPKNEDGGSLGISDIDGGSLRKFRSDKKRKQMEACSEIPNTRTEQTVVKGAATLFA
jgi:hypothetical protein